VHLLCGGERFRFGILLFLVLGLCCIHVRVLLLPGSCLVGAFARRQQPALAGGHGETKAALRLGILVLLFVLTLNAAKKSGTVQTPSTSRETHP